MSINVICCPYFSGSKMGGSDNDIIFVSAQPTSWLLGFELSLRRHHRVLGKDISLQISQNIGLPLDKVFLEL